MIFYTNHFIPAQSAGCMRVFLIPLIFIRPKYKDDVGILAHEKVHVSQAWRNVLPQIHALRYAFSKPYRLACEVEAYKEQMKHSPQYTLQFAAFISNDYGLSIDSVGALRLLQGK